MDVKVAHRATLALLIIAALVATVIGGVFLSSWAHANGVWWASAMTISLVIYAIAATVSGISLIYMAEAGEFDDLIRWGLGYGGSE